MKNQKTKLTELKVKSFVTDMENRSEKTIKGGADAGITHLGTDCMPKTSIIITFPVTCISRAGLCE